MITILPEILVDSQNGVLTLTFNRLDKKNSVTSSMYAALADEFEEAKSDKSIRVVVLQGHEQIFSAGNDLGDFLKSPPTSDDAPVWRFLHGISSFPKPIIAAVCGAAVGIGTTLLLHCDLVYAGSNAKFSLPFVNLGLCPEAASSFLLPRLMGHQRASEALLFGDPLSVEEAARFGIVNRVLPPEEVNAYAQAQARKLAEKPLSSLLETKRLLKLETGTKVKERMKEEGQVFSQMLDAPAVKEAISAFMEKRKPDFSKTY
jgi:enoyl-CoA hydratase/carnithine racemase